MDHEYIQLQDKNIYQYQNLQMNKRLIITFVADTNMNELIEKSFDIIKIYNRGGSLIDTIIGFNTIYRIDDHTLELSNDGSVYIEPNKYEKVDINSNIYDIKNIVQENNFLNITFVNEIPNGNIDTQTIINYDVYGNKKEEFNGYNTIYRVIDKYVQFSNDGSIYIEPREYEYVKIGTDETEYDIESINVDGILLTIQFINDICIIPGTIVHYDVNQNEIEHFDEYTTLYRIDGNTVYFSNDGSEYNPEKEKQKMLADAKEKKIQEMSIQCSENIRDGVYVYIDGETIHFSYTAEDQQNIKSAFDLANQTHFAIPYHADAMSCRLFTPEEISKVYITEQVNLIHHITYFNQLKQMINNMDNISSVNSVYYGYELVGEYLETYNKIMNQTYKIVELFVEEE